MASGFAGSAPAEKQPILDSHAKRIHESANDVQQAANEFHSIADRIFGCQPTAVADQSNKAPQSSSLSKLDEAHDHLAVSRDSLRAALNRLSSL